jgi:hypothetical protein
VCVPNDKCGTRAAWLTLVLGGAGLGTLYLLLVALVPNNKKQQQQQQQQRSNGSSSGSSLAGLLTVIVFFYQSADIVLLNGTWASLRRVFALDALGLRSGGLCVRAGLSTTNAIALQYVTPGILFAALFLCMLVSWRCRRLRGFCCCCVCRPDDEEALAASATAAAASSSSALLLLDDYNNVAAFTSSSSSSSSSTSSSSSIDAAVVQQEQQHQQQQPQPLEDGGNSSTSNIDCWIVLCRHRRRLASFSLWTACARLLFFSYALWVRVTLQLVHCKWLRVPGTDTRRWFLFEAAGESQCFETWQVALFGVLVALVLVPIVLWWCLRRQRRRSGSSNKFVCALRAVAQNAYHVRAWHSVLLLQLLVLAFVRAFVAAPMYRALCLAGVTMLGLVAHTTMQPFRSRTVNVLQTCLLSMVSLLAILGVPRGTVQADGISDTGRHRGSDIPSSVFAACLCFPLVLLAGVAAQRVHQRSCRGSSGDSAGKALRADAAHRLQ